MECLVSIDPGRHKCGLVLVAPQLGIVLDGKIASPKRVREIVLQWKEKAKIERLILGNGTSSSEVYGILREILPVTLVNEKGTTIRARNRYYELWPISKFLGWFPKGLLLPPNDLDAVAALVLLEDFLEKKFTWPGPQRVRNELSQ
ncbi:resolvase [Prochlorococcus sp. MIT 1341]|uniref:resolvase n=1 Tax=Prochlorococcus sp. MIT 1341 TaxID=3096221 RepID=UPI002A750D61|nr:resolvase [Prochlorococcus sp. MIT 1341]